MDFDNLIHKNRSYRRFDESFRIEKNLLKELVNYARLSPSGKNIQPLKFILSNEKDTNSLIFPYLAWAGYLKDWDGPKEGERPSAYIVILHDKSISSNYFCDHGIMTQSIMLGSVNKGLGGCIIASVNKKKLRESLNIDEKFEILLVLALGKPIEEVKTYDIDSSDDIKYWRDENKVHHVPKRKLSDLIIDV